MGLGLLDTKPEERFDAITREATEVFNVSMSTITIIDDKREWYKSCQGLDEREAPRSASFCAHAMLGRGNDVFVVEDALKDERFSDNPMVVGKPFIRFYAGVSLHSPDGTAIGVFCIKDSSPRSLTTSEVALMIDFATRAEAELNKGK